ncbi:NTP transferase domain-containing protein [Nocardioides sp. zg-536]|uniref:NTP transferase domain-containing protein n=1 Tax=Nocardioides faecalis TaxID=2803858 RepID=A0A939BUN3_9ACTN|nr:NTP transferase domain-containing protein [Nocardioides faecalis]MBM9458682.1 NTP transferase domain-containing protein [Nocardioides faecalis]QVI58674.1 NTP transferase domain-containing protein [Nocardioides faecalis]
MIEPGLLPFAAIILAGGRGARLGGADKASIELAGRTLLDRALDAVMDASEVVVVGHQVPTERPVTFVLEDPRHGGPAAGLLTGRDALLRTFPTLAVLAVDMPHLTPATLRRLHEAAVGHQGAVLVDAEGRRHLAYVLHTQHLDAVRPGREEQHNMSMRALLADLDLAEVAQVGRESEDIDTWTDLRDAHEDPQQH